ncbi:MAG TPA: EVE domain-containing protein [Polyangia bacterium]
MSYWLLKTEPSTYSFADLVAAKETRWDGIENPAALKLMKTAAVGDRCVVYHTGDERSAVGECEIIKSAYPDPKSARLVVIDVRAGKPLAKPVSLAIIKRDPLFADSPLVRQGRLSFVPLTDAQWKRLHELAAL